MTAPLIPTSELRTGDVVVLVEARNASIGSWELHRRYFIKSAGGRDSIWINRATKDGREHRGKNSWTGHYAGCLWRRA